MRVLVVGGLASSLIHFRGPLIGAMLQNGHTVVGCANGRDEVTERRLAEMGVGYHPVRLGRAGMNPVADAVTISDLVRVMRVVKPDVVFGYTIKPAMYSTLAARLCGVRRTFSMVEGAGHTFMPCESLAHFFSSFVGKCLFHVGLPWNHRVIFVNPDDCEMFTKGRYVRPHRTVVVDGMGVDLLRYAYHPPTQDNDIQFLLVGRLLKHKGVREYLAAAKLVRSKYPHVRFQLAGDLDANPASLTKDELDAWIRQGTVEYLGQLDDVRPAYARCSVHVLPSYYREGTPQVNLEAMAIGRPIITTDSPGCRETILRKTSLRSRKGEWEHPAKCSGTDQRLLDEWARSRGLEFGANGILVPVRNAEALAAAMTFFIENPDQLAVMGRASRQYAEQRYDVHKVNAAMLAAMGLD